MIHIKKNNLERKVNENPLCGLDPLFTLFVFLVLILFCDKHSTCFSK